MAISLQQGVKTLRPVAVWLLGFIAVALIGGSLAIDLAGRSVADQYVLARWSFGGLRVYLWLEGAVLAGVVAALGMHVLSTGFSFTRGSRADLFGIPLRVPGRLPPSVGYVFVVLGAALVALSFTTLVLLNSCRYMRLV